MLRVMGLPSEVQSSDCDSTPLCELNDGVQQPCRRDRTTGIALCAVAPGTVPTRIIFQGVGYSNLLVGGEDEEQADRRCQCALLPRVTAPRWLKRLDDSVLWWQCVAEFFGTALMVALGTATVSAAAIAGAHNGLFQVAVTWGLAVALAIACTGSISGAHLNPAVSLAFALSRPRDFAWRRLAPYWIAQLGGAVMGSALNWALYGGAIDAFEQANGIVRGSDASIRSAMVFGEYFPPPGSKVGDVGALRAIFAEAFGTGVLMFVILGLIDQGNVIVSPKGAAVPLFIGATVAVLISTVAPLTQAGFNPARDFGPRMVALAAGWGPDVSLRDAWVYVVGPMIGAPLGALVYDISIGRGLKAVRRASSEVRGA
jgi:glycerol uptake facilitator protein